MDINEKLIKYISTTKLKKLCGEVEDQAEAAEKIYLQAQQFLGLIEAELQSREDDDGEEGGENGGKEDEADASDMTPEQLEHEEEQEAEELERTNPPKKRGRKPVRPFSGEEMAEADKKKVADPAPAPKYSKVRVWPSFLTDEEQQAAKAKATEPEPEIDDNESEQAEEH